MSDFMILMMTKYLENLHKNSFCPSIPLQKFILLQAVYLILKCPLNTLFVWPFIHALYFRLNLALIEGYAWHIAFFAFDHNKCTQIHGSFFEPSTASVLSYFDCVAIPRYIIMHTFNPAAPFTPDTLHSMLIRFTAKSQWNGKDKC